MVTRMQGSQVGQSPWAVLTKYHKVGGLHNRHCLLVSWFWRLAVYVQGARRVGVRENLFHASPVAFDGLLAIFDLPWLIDTCPCPLLSCSHGIFPVWMTEFPLSIKTPVILD